MPFHYSFKNNSFKLKYLRLMERSLSSPPRRQKRHNSDIEEEPIGIEEEPLPMKEPPKFITPDNIDHLKALLISGEISDVNVKDVNKLSLLTIAAKEGRIDYVKLLLEHGAIQVKPRPYKDDFYNESALCEACKIGRTDIITLLLAHGADPNIRSGLPLHIAATLGRADIVKLLIDHNVRVNIHQELSGNAIEVATVYSDEDFIKYLTKEGACMRNEAEHVLNALLIAYLRGHTDVMEVLLDNGAHIDAVDGNQDSCLNHACQKGDMNMIKFLISRGADATVYNSKGYSPFITAYNTGNREAIDLFLQHGVDLNAMNNGWWLGNVAQQCPSPLIHVCAAGDVEMIDLLIQHGADINLQYIDKDVDYTEKVGTTNSPIIASCTHGHPDALQVLLDHGADPEKVDDFANTPLLYLLLTLTSRSEGIIACITLLLQHININHTNKQGNTALLCLYKRKIRLPTTDLLRCVELLLEYGVDVTVKNKKNECILDLVVAGSEVEVMIKEHLDRKPVLK